jgi:hypothetical protein
MAIARVRVVRPSEPSQADGRIGWSAHEIEMCRRHQIMEMVKMIGQLRRRVRAWSAFEAMR